MAEARQRAATTSAASTTRGDAVGAAIARTSATERTIGGSAVGPLGGRCGRCRCADVRWAAAPRTALVAGGTRQTEEVTELRPAANADAAEWLLRAGVDWWDLVRYGPPGFDVYVRITFTLEAEGAELAGEEPGLRAALATLARYTATPASAHAAIWEGWTGPDPAPEAPRVDIPHRAMLLFTGPVEVMRDAPALAWYGSAQGRYQAPHLVWPEDHAWCLACEVDEEIEFTVGCSIEAFQALASALPGGVRRVRYGELAPLYRENP